MKVKKIKTREYVMSSDEAGIVLLALVDAKADLKEWMDSYDINNSTKKIISRIDNVLDMFVKVDLK